jgi:hypothetical protein
MAESGNYFCSGGEKALFGMGGSRSGVGVVPEWESGTVLPRKGNVTNLIDYKWLVDFLMPHLSRFGTVLAL